MLRQLITPTFEEEGYFQLKICMTSSKRSIIGVSVNWFVILKIIKRLYFRLLSARDSNLNKAK